MQPGFSKLLINENVVPNVGAAWSIIPLDWLMIALGAVRAEQKSNGEVCLGRQEGVRVTGI